MTGPKNLLCWPTMTNVDILLVQEHKTMEANTAQLSAKLLYKGWKACLSQAVETEGGGASGRVGIRTRLYVDCWYEDDFELEPGRAVVAHARADELGLVTFYAADFTACVGLDWRNKFLANKILMSMAAHGRPVLAGADWNLDPQVLRKLLPEPPTCRTSTGCTVRDYFAVSEALSAALQKLKWSAAAFCQHTSPCS